MAGPSEQQGAIGPESRVAGLAAVTRALRDADSRAAVASVAVDHADGTLDLPLVSVVYYDRETGGLVPAAETPSAAEQVPADLLCEDDDEPLWQGFVANDPVDVTDDANRIADGEDLTEVLAVPMHREGMLLVATTAPKGFSSAARDLATALAGVVEAAATRVRQDRQLAEQEAALTDHEATLSRLELLTSTVRDAGRALVRAGTRSEVEQVVTSKLAGMDGYELALVGRYESVTDEVVPGAWAGGEALSRDQVGTLLTADANSDGPVERTVDTRSRQVVDSVVGQRSFTAWREAAFSRGYQACVVLPLEYGETLYGVLAVYAGSPNVFVDLELAVLTGFATTTAQAINAVESKRALVSDEVTELEFAVTDRNLEIVQLSREVDCRFVLESLVPKADGRLRVFFSTHGAPVADVLAFGPKLAVTDMSLLSEYTEDGEEHGLFEAVLSDESLTRTAVDHGGRPTRIVIEDGTASVTLEVAADADVRTFVEVFQAKYPASTLEAQRTRERPRKTATELFGVLTETLTPRQLEVFQTAYYSGYFDEPRRQSARDVAETLGITQPTFSSHLHAAERKLCRQLFEREILYE